MKFLKSGRTYLWAGIIAVVAAAGFFFATAGSSAETVAEVGGAKITKDDLYDSLVEMYGADATESLIADKIVEKETVKEKIEVTDKEIQEELNAAIESYGGEEAYASALESSGMTEEDMKEDIKAYLQTVKLLEPRIEITDEEISAYFEENKDTFATPEQIEASHILVDDEKTANEVAKKLADGSDFAELAKEYSTDTTSAENGGELGFFGTGEMVEQFEKTAFAMKVGEISDPVKTDYGYHIIKVTDKQEAKAANLKDSSAEIKETLTQEKLSTEYTAWLEEKKEEYDIYNSFES
ncbi:peptidylprolyl isomerase [Domibacillus indicus]|uniref:peptidylprolyl isomerase n=1 Tax=Domibacillus indicus TaxID=1437523 RepID=UPI000617BD50|nr:peptidylprolyl isomerase [Domibacillus indicus]